MGHMKVVFDIDDVLMPWAEKVHQACVAAGLNPENREWTQWSMWDDYGCSKEEWIEVVNGLAKPGGLYHAPAYPGAVEAVRRVCEAGHEVHLVTARGFHDHAEQIREWTREWVRSNDLPGFLDFAEKKGVAVSKIKATHAIDDRFENCAEMVGAGADVYMMNQPHNKSALWPESRRVSSVSEFVDRILS